MRLSELIRTPVALTLPGLLTVLTICSTPALVARELAAKQLRCEYLENPLGIETTMPRLGWTVTSDQRGEKQTAYQVLL